MGEYVFPYYAEKLEDVADDCEDDAKVMTPSLVNSPWLIIRERGDLRLRTLVAKLAYCAFHLFLKILPSTIATVTNVIRECEDTDLVSKKMTRHSSACSWRAAPSLDSSYLWPLDLPDVSSA